MTPGMSSITNCSKISALILLFVSIAVAFRDPMNYMYGSHKVDTRSTRHYCGNNLVRALHFLCESYNKRSHLPIHSYRLSQDSEDDMTPEDDGIDGSEHSLSLIKVLNNNNNMKYFHRMVRGVVDECCRRSCSTSQLSQYCGVTRVTTTTAAPLVVE